MGFFTLIAADAVTLVHPMTAAEKGTIDWSWIASFWHNSRIKRIAVVE
jgi:hypothetical protein